MAACDGCGNEYDKLFNITHEGRSGVFDSFECAIHDMVPICVECGCNFIGDGVKAENNIYCRAHCVSEDVNQSASNSVSVSLLINGVMAQLPSVRCVKAYSRTA